MEIEIYVLDSKCGECNRLSMGKGVLSGNLFFCDKNTVIINLPKYVLPDFMKGCQSFDERTVTSPIIDPNILEEIIEEELYYKVLQK